MILDDDVIELRKFLRRPVGQRLLAGWRAEPPKSPVQVGEKMEVHHVQVNYGFDLGVRAMLDRMVSDAEREPAPAPDTEAPTLHDTRQLS